MRQCVSLNASVCVPLTRRLSPGASGADGGRRAFRTRHSEGRQRDGDPDEVHQEDRGEPAGWGRVTLRRR